jgi:hypothetical protein
MKKHSCGALLYTVLNNKIYIILGMEKGKWYPFKGTREKGETNELAAIREIYEETCGVVKLNKINLRCNFTTKRKHYHIGLIKIEPDFINKFYKNKKFILNQIESINSPPNYIPFLEKNEIKMFTLDDINYKKFHHVTITPINFYYDFLKSIEKQHNVKTIEYINKSRLDILNPKIQIAN